jgi:CheY-like chemotaxis protein
VASTILVVDDEPAVVSTLKLVLESKGHSVETAASAADARRLLAARAFDLVLTDMRMENDCSGYEVASAAGAQPSRPAVVVLTAFPLMGSHWKQAGVDALLSKPVSIPHLLDTIARLTVPRPSSAPGAGKGKEVPGEPKP